MPPSTANERPRHIGLLLFDGVEELDAVGPWEVLAYWTQQHPEDGWTVSCLSPDGGAVVGAKNLVLGAHHSIDGRARHWTCSSTRAATAPGDCSATRTPGLGPRAARGGAPAWPRCAPAASSTPPPGC